MAYAKRKTTTKRKTVARGRNSNSYSRVGGYKSSPRRKNTARRSSATPTIKLVIEQVSSPQQVNFGQVMPDNSKSAGKAKF